MKILHLTDLHGAGINKNILNLIPSADYILLGGDFGSNDLHYELVAKHGYGYSRKISKDTAEKLRLQYIETMRRDIDAIEEYGRNKMKLWIDGNHEERIDDICKEFDLKNENANDVIRDYKRTINLVPIGWERIILGSYVLEGVPYTNNVGENEGFSKILKLGNSNLPKILLTHKIPAENVDHCNTNSKRIFRCGHITDYAMKEGVFIILSGHTHMSERRRIYDIPYINSGALGSVSIIEIEGEMIISDLFIPTKESEDEYNHLKPLMVGTDWEKEI